MNKQYGIIHVVKGRSLSMLVDVCKCGHTHDSHKYFDFLWVRFLLGTDCYYCNCSRFHFQTKMSLKEAVDNIDKL